MTHPILQISAFIALTFVLIYLSRKPLLNKEAHGFTRFFAWEAILALLVLNAPVWHAHMFAPIQLLSWLLLFISALLAFLGLSALKTLGLPSGHRHDNSLYKFEKTQQLVTTHIYGLIRHPMYAALLFLAWGAYLKNMTLLNTLLVLFASFALWLTAKRDEAECLVFFGDDYARYMQVSKRFLPFLF